MDDEAKDELARRVATRLAALVALVDELLAEVFDNPRYDLEGDEAQSFFVAAYGRAYRCMIAIRNLAAWPTCDADHAFVLTRSLVSLVARSVWLVAPDDTTERADRFRRWQLDSAIERRTMLRDWNRLGIDFAPEALEQIEEFVERAKAEGVQPMPPVQQLLQHLKIEQLYGRAYRPASDVAHFSLGSAVHGFTEAITLGDVENREVGFRQLRPDHAEEALALATIAYGEFLQRAEPMFGHGIAARTAVALNAWMERYVIDES